MFNFKNNQNTRHYSMEISGALVGVWVKNAANIKIDSILSFWLGIEPYTNKTRIEGTLNRNKRYSFYIKINSFAAPSIYG